MMFFLQDSNIAVGFKKSFSKFLSLCDTMRAVECVKFWQARIYKRVLYLVETNKRWKRKVERE